MVYEHLMHLTWKSSNKVTKLVGCFRGSSWLFDIIYDHLIEMFSMLYTYSINHLQLKPDKSAEVMLLCWPVIHSSFLSTLMSKVCSFHSFSETWSLAAHWALRNTHTPQHSSPPLYPLLSSPLQLTCPSLHHLAALCTSYLPGSHIDSLSPLEAIWSVTRKATMSTF